MGEDWRVQQHRLQETADWNVAEGEASGSRQHEARLCRVRRGCQTCHTSSKRVHALRCRYNLSLIPACKGLGDVVGGIVLAEAHGTGWNEAVARARAALDSTAFRRSRRG